MSSFSRQGMLFSIILLCSSSALMSKPENQKVGWSDIQKIKTCIEVKLWSTGLTGVIALDPMKWGVKYEMPVADSMVDAKWKTEFTVGDAITSTQWLGQLASYSLIDGALQTNTWFGEKVAVLSSYLLTNKAVRAKIAQLIALKKQTPQTLTQKREQISKIIALQAEITALLGC